MSHPSHSIFNVEEPHGKEKVELETTAGEAQINAPDAVAARQVERNADRAHEAAAQAASIAKTMGSDLTGEKTTAIDQFRNEASRTTDAAVSEGKHDVDAAKATGVGYVEQAKSIASNAISTAQSYLPAAVGGKQTHDSTTGSSNPPGIVSSIQSTASSALNTTSQCISAAKDSAQPQLEKVKGVAQGYLGTAGTQGSQVKGAGDIPATRAPLESGPHTIGTPYPSTTTTGPGVAENQGDRSVN